ncbi:MAG: hypothetical protein WCH40_08970, partial [Verrucomicrobiales bacterium]
RTIGVRRLGAVVATRATATLAALATAAALAATVSTAAATLVSTAAALIATAVSATITLRWGGSCRSRSRCGGWSRCGLIVLVCNHEIDLMSGG